MVRQSLIFFIFLSSANFFALAFLPRRVILVFSFISVFLLVLVWALGLVYDRKKRFESNFSFEVWLILMSAITAIFGAKWGHNQGYLLSVWSELFMFYYFFYFFLHAVRIRIEELLNLLVIMGIIYVASWYIQYLLYPTMIFDTRMDESRGTIRLFLPGGSFSVLVYMYFLDIFQRTNKAKYVLISLAILTIPVLQGTRSAIVVLLFGTLLLILFSSQVKSKLRNIILVLSGAVLVLFLFQDILYNLVEVTEEQTSQQGEDVRIRAAKFFLSDFYPNRINYIIGNGVGHMMSGYGMKIAYYKITYGFYQSDIGLIGNYTEYGILFILGSLLVLRKMFIIKIQTKYNFLKYWTVLLIIGFITGSNFTRPDGIVLITTVLYIIDVSAHELKPDN